MLFRSLKELVYLSCSEGAQDVIVSMQVIRDSGEEGQVPVASRTRAVAWEVSGVGSTHSLAASPLPLRVNDDNSDGHAEMRDGLVVRAGAEAVACRGSAKGRTS